MKSILTLAFASIIMFANAQNIPDFTLTDTDGQSHHLFEYLQKKQAVVIDFFLETCGSCGPAAVLLEQVYQDYGQNQGWIKVLAMECDTATPAEVDAWMSANGATFPAIAGLDAHSYWKTNWYPMLGGQFNQCIGIFPTAFTNPQSSYLDFIYIGLMTSTQQQELIDKLHQYSFYAGLQDVPEGTDTLAVYPNPAGESLGLFIKGIDPQSASYSILDMQGRTVATGIPGTDITIESLQPGIYLLVLSGQGKNMSIRFVKQ